MRQYLASFFAGLLFGVGLAVAQMTRPGKVLGFLDVAGNWDPSLALVLGGAVGVTVLAFRFILRRKAPLFGASFQVPVGDPSDRPLVFGAVLFGVGWGISGYCPGPAIAALAAPNHETWIFLPAMAAGIYLQRMLARAFASARDT